MMFSSFRLLNVRYAVFSCYLSFWLIWCTLCRHVSEFPKYGPALHTETMVLQIASSVWKSFDESWFASTFSPFAFLTAWSTPESCAQFASTATDLWITFVDLEFCSSEHIFSIPFACRMSFLPCYEAEHSRRQFETASISMSSRDPLFFIWPHWITRSSLTLAWIGMITRESTRVWTSFSLIITCLQRCDFKSDSNADATAASRVAFSSVLLI